MGESGQIFSFPMTPEETAARDTAKIRLSDLHQKIIADKRQPVAYEMAESGIIIEFYEPILEDQTVKLAGIEKR